MLRIITSIRHHHHWTAVLSRGWVKVSAGRLQVSQSFNLRAGLHGPPFHSGRCGLEGGTEVGIPKPSLGSCVPNTEELYPPSIYVFDANHIWPCNESALMKLYSTLNRNPSCYSAVRVSNGSTTYLPTYPLPKRVEIS